MRRHFETPRCPWGVTTPVPMTDSLLVHEAFVRRLAQGLAGGDADDLAQETWVRALQARDTRLDNVRAWLATIAANLWRNQRRALARGSRRSAAAVEGNASPSVDDILAREEVRRQVVAAVVALPERLRSVVLLRYYEGLDSFAIGERLALPASTVRSRLQAAHEMLRRRLDAVHGERRDAWVAPLAQWLPHGRLGLAAVLRAVWVVRAVAGAAVLLLLAWLVAPSWLQAPPPPTVPPVAGDAATAREYPREARAEREPERASVASNAASDQRGPEDLWGRVVAATDGAPIAGAEVVLEHRDADELNNLDLEYGKRIEVLGTARSDGDGRFAFRVERAWQHRLAVRAAGFAPGLAWRCTGGSEVIVELARPASVTGTVRRRADAAPIADAVVRALVRGGNGDWSTTSTAADGSFTLTDLVPEPSYVSAHATGFAQSWELRELSPGETDHLDIVIDAGRSLRGVVRDAVTKQPIGRASVATDWTMRDAVRSGADGAFAIAGLDERQDLHVRADGYAPWVRHRLAVDGAGEIEVSLARGITVVGRIVDASSQPLPGTYVAAGADEWSQGSVDTHWLPAVVAADGTFRITGVLRYGLHQEIAWNLLARAPRYGTRVLALPAERLTGEFVDLGTIVLQPQAILEGCLREPDGAPVAGAEIDVDGVGHGFSILFGNAATGGRPSHHFARRSTRTAGDGTFRVAGLAAGSYRVRADLGGDDLRVPEKPCEVRDGEIVVLPDLVVARGLAIAGVVRIAGQRGLLPDQKVSVTADPAKGNGRSASVARDGTFRIDQLDPGPCLLYALDVPAGFALAPRTVEAGATGVELDLVPAAVLEGRVVDHDGAPVKRASVYFFPEGVFGARNFFTDADGRFRLEVSPVRGKLGATHPDHFMRQVQLEDIDPPRSDLVLRLPK